MSKQTQTAPVPRLTILGKGIDAADLGVSSITDLETLFTAIAELSEKPSTINSLAKIGRYLSEDWRQLIQGELEKLEKIAGDES